MRYPLDKLDNYFLNYNKITENMKYQVFDIDAKELITLNRIDLVIKYYYIECRENNQNYAFAKELYEKHIEAFTDSTFLEPGNPDKDSIEKYIEAFDNLIDAFKENRFDLSNSMIPVGKNYELLDGAHRAACAAYFNQKIKVIRFPALSVNYGFKFFRRRLLDNYYLEFVEKKFAALKDNVYIVFVGSKIAESRKFKVMKEILREKQCKVIYRKRLRSYKWKGSPQILMVDCPSLELLNKSIGEIRAVFRIYGSEGKEETIEVLNRSDEVFHSNLKQNRSLKHPKIKFLGRKTRNVYRVAINNVKSFLGKPV